MVVHVIPLEVGFELSIKPSIAESQIKSFLAGYRGQAETYLQGLVAAAPSAAQATYVGSTFEYEQFTNEGPGRWWIEITMMLTVEVADSIEAEQVWGYLVDYYTETKVKFRALVAAAPNNTKAEIVRWHIHRGYAASDDSVEP